MPRTILLLLTCLLLLSGCTTTPPPPQYAEVTDAHRALAAEARSLIAEQGNTELPAREFINRLKEPRYQEWLTMLSGEVTADPGALNWPAKDITNIVARAKAGLDWPEMPIIDVPRAEKPPVIDGKLDDPLWQTARRMEGNWPFNSTEPGGPASIYYLAWDDTYLYVAFDLKDHDLQAEERERDGEVWNDDAAEIFILPDLRFRTYWELIISPNGSIYDSIQCKNMHAWGCNHDPSQNIEGMQVGIELHGTLNDSSDVDEGFTVEVAIPWDQLQPYQHTKPVAGHILYFMMVQLDRNGTDKRIHPYAFQPLLGWGHNIWNHARMRLVDGQ